MPPYAQRSLDFIGRIAVGIDQWARRPGDVSADTKFDLSKMLVLPYSNDYFSVPPHAPHGPNPKLGTLHPSMVGIAAAAFAAKRAVTLTPWTFWQ